MGLRERAGSAVTLPRSQVTFASVAVRWRLADRNLG